MTTSARFECVPGAAMGGSKIRNSGPSTDPSMQPGEFLARLWHLFDQPPSAMDEGFSYSVRDRQTGACFTAYSGASGPAYGGDSALTKVLDAFDALVAGTDPIECEFVYGAFDSGESRRAMGFRDGKAYDRVVRSPAAANPRSVTRPADCEVIAVRLGGGYGIRRGWQKAFEKLVKIPPSIVFGGRTYENCVGLVVDDDIGPTLVYDEGPGIEEIGIEEALDPLDATTRIWLQAWDDWHDAQGLPRRSRKRRLPA